MLHRGADFLVGGCLGSFERKIDHGNCRGWYAEGHAGELAFHFGDRQTDRARCTSGAGDDVDCGGTATFPVLLRGTVDCFLGRGVGMNGRHKTFFHSEAFLQENMHHWGKTVGRATRVGNNVVIGRLVFLVVDTHHDSDVFAFGWRGNDHLFCTGFNVAVCLFSFGEESSGFDYNVDS